MKATGISGKQSMPISAAISVTITFVIMLLGCMVIASVILSGGIQEEKTGIIVKLILAAAVFVGVKLNTALQIKNKYMAAGVYTAAIVLLILISGISLGIRINNILMNLLFVLCGAGVGMLLGNKKIKKHSRFKKRYR